MLPTLLGILEAVAFWMYDASLYKKGIMIYQKDKPIRFILRALVACILSFVLCYNEMSSNIYYYAILFCSTVFVIGSSFWLVFDSLMGCTIKKNIFYTGKESHLDEIGNSKKSYFIFKCLLYLISIIIYYGTNG